MTFSSQSECPVEVRGGVGLDGQFPQEAQPFFDFVCFDAPTAFRRQQRVAYLQMPEFLTKHSVEVVDGWFLGTNTNTPHKKETIRAAADVAGLKLGQDIVVDL